MPQLNRDFFGAYYMLPETSGKVFYGADILHAYNCGRFLKDGVQYTLWFMQFCKDDLPDTQGRWQEMLDFSLLFSDLDKQPIVAALLQDPVYAMTVMSPVAAELVRDDLDDGLDAFDILDLRAGILVPEFLGFTLEQVLAWKPEVMQYIESTEDGVTTVVPSVYRCSLESE